MFKSRLLIIIFLFLILPTAGFAATRNVPSADYATIQAAVTAASSGDTINVAAGTYAEGVSVSGKNLIFTGADASTTIIDNSAVGSAVTVAGAVTSFSISGFTLIGHSNSQGIAIGSSSAMSASVTNCIIKTPTLNGIFVDSAAVTLTVNQCTFSQIGSDGIAFGSGSGATATITNCIFANCGSTGISDGSGGGFSFTLNNNCMYKNTNGNYSGPTAPATDVNVNPNFVTGTFKLYTGSPLIGAGITLNNIGWYQGSGEAGGNYAATIYVSPSGNDSTGTGTVANPFRSLTKGTTWLGSSGTLYALAGTYNAAGGETFPIIVPPNATVTRSGSGTVSIVGGSSSETIQLNNNSVLSNVTVSGSFPGSNSNVRGVVYASGITNATVSNVVAYSTATPPTHAGFWMDAVSGTVNITNCIAYDVSMGFFGYNGGTYNFTNCAAYHCTTTAGTYIFPGEGAGFGAGSGATVKVKNSIATNSEYGLGTIGLIAGTINSSTYNCIFGNTTENYRTGVASAGTGDISLDPRYIDATNHNFRLQTKTLGYAFDSPCIDSGTSSGAPTTDIEGTTRPQGSAFDIGAYEALDKSSYHSSVSKVSNKKKATVGDIVTYTLTIKSPATQSVVNAQLVDVTPKGFKYVNGTTTLDNVKQADPTGTTTRTFTLGTLAANTTYTLKYKLVVGSGVDFGDYTNTATLYSTSDNSLSGTAKETVTIVANPLFYTATILGKVYNDQNKNQVQDNGEEGLPDVELGLETGLRVKTDAYGRFHIENLKPQTHIIGLDTTTLPKGSKLTTPNPVLLTAVSEAIPLKANFGVWIPEEKKK